MIANPVKRYFWLVDTIYRHAPISFKEIAQRWEQSSLYDKKKLAIRTFHNHREAIEELFHIRIVCDERTNKYYIADKFYYKNIYVFFYCNHYVSDFIEPDTDF